MIGKNITDSHEEGCLRCALKHILNGKTFLMEAIQFGLETEVTVEELNKVTLELVTYILDEKGA